MKVLFCFFNMSLPHSWWSLLSTCIYIYCHLPWSTVHSSLFLNFQISWPLTPFHHFSSLLFFRTQTNRIFTLLPYLSSLPSLPFNREHFKVISIYSLIIFKNSYSLRAAVFLLKISSDLFSAHWSFPTLILCKWHLCESAT